MIRNASAQTYIPEMVATDIRSQTDLINDREEQLRLAGVYADYRIWPLDAIGRRLFVPGMTVAAYLGHPSPPAAAERLRLLSELCCCLNAGVVQIRHPDYRP